MLHLSHSPPSLYNASAVNALRGGFFQRGFMIPTQFLNLSIFDTLLKKVEEEFGFQTCGGLVLPCEVGFFKGVLKILEKDEQRFHGVELEEVFKTFSKVKKGLHKPMSKGCKYGGSWL
ncbi:protein SMALL AUXIN UP-REGULATED RNA 51-like [Magnolia sinica]|uniref:protein SMALL AUXIN UP-REGULATED RNA 51-like n=1 Tax=Magnolia sinica TaxID=86752 RepID=UPI00265B0187|nr:protein SMALL AUXIN UP-REGULATED RNA 51-like [Magnolia sinica]